MEVQVLSRTQQGKPPRLGNLPQSGRLRHRTGKHTGNIGPLGAQPSRLEPCPNGDPRAGAASWTRPSAPTASRARRPTRATEKALERGTTRGGAPKQSTRPTVGEGFPTGGGLNRFTAVSQVPLGTVSRDPKCHENPVTLNDMEREGYRSAGVLDCASHPRNSKFVATSA